MSDLNRYHMDPLCKHDNLLVQRNEGVRWVTCEDCMTDFYPRRKSVREISEELGIKIDEGDADDRRARLDMISPPQYPEDFLPRMKWYENPSMIPAEELMKWREEHPGEEFELEHAVEIIEWDALKDRDKLALLRGLDDIEHGRYGPRTLRSDPDEM